MTVDSWQLKAEKLAEENERLRLGIIAVRTRMRDISHILMDDGRTVGEFCRTLLVGPPPEPPSIKDNREEVVT
jgi:hypothetical protein